MTCIVSSRHSEFLFNLHCRDKNEIWKIKLLACLVLIIYINRFVPREKMNQRCDPIVREECGMTMRTECQNLCKEKCENEDKKVCMTIPHQECNERPVENCQDVPSTNCRKVSPYQNATSY